MMKNLHFFTLTEMDELARPDGDPSWTLASPALEFFTDFNQVEPLVIENSLSALEARLWMKKTHTQLQCVIDDKGQFIGIISEEDLIDLKFVQKVSEGVNRKDISLMDLMIPKRKLRVLDYCDVAESTIADIICTLQNVGERYCLVMDRQQHKIRGVFSAQDISKKLHLPVNIGEKPSFTCLFSATI